MPATFDIQSAVGRNRQQMNRRVEIYKEINFATMFAAGLAATQTASFMKTPKGFVYEDCHPVLLVAEGEVATIHIGIEADADGMLAGGSVNGTINTAIAKAGTETLKAGALLSETEVWVSVPAAAATVNVAKVGVMLIGYTADIP